MEKSIWGWYPFIWLILEKLTDKVYHVLEWFAFAIRTKFRNEIQIILYFIILLKGLLTCAKKIHHAPEGPAVYV